MDITIGPWDILLVLAVSVQGTIIAYLRDPKWKALLLSLPIPFTIATLALGQAVDVTNVLGLVTLLLFTHGVRVLYQRVRIPIVPAIVISGVIYCLVSVLMARILFNNNDALFWWAGVFVFLLGALLYLVTPHQPEPGSRTSLPVWIKLPIIIGVVLFLVVIKQWMRGFMTVFPMVGVIAMYEARKSLGTMCRQIPVVMLTILPMMVVCRLAQESIGLGWSLVLGWIVFVIAIVPLTRYMWNVDKI